MFDASAFNQVGVNAPARGARNQGTRRARRHGLLNVQRAWLVRGAGEGRGARGGAGSAGCTGAPDVGRLGAAGGNGAADATAEPHSSAIHEIGNSCKRI